MRLLTLDHLRNTPADQEFAPSRITPMVICIAFSFLFLVSIAPAANLIPHGPVPVYLFWGLMFIFLFLAIIGFLSYKSVVRAGNWLCRAHGNTLWIRCSYGPNPNALVLELDRSEIAYAQALKLTYVWKWGGKRFSTGRDYEFYRYFELGLIPSAAVTLDAFAADEKIALEIRRQIVPSSEIFNMPARMIKNGLLRLCWTGISPGLKGAEKYFSHWTEIRPLRRERMSNV